MSETASRGRAAWRRGPSRTAQELWERYEGVTRLEEVDLGPLDRWLQQETSGEAVVEVLRRFRREVRHYVLPRLRREALTLPLLRWAYRLEKPPLSEVLLSHPQLEGERLREMLGEVEQSWRGALDAGVGVSENLCFWTANHAALWLKAMAERGVLSAEESRRLAGLVTREAPRLVQQSVASVIREALYALPELDEAEIAELWSTTTDYVLSVGSIRDGEAEAAALNPRTPLDVLQSMAILLVGAGDQARAPVRLAERPEVWQETSLRQVLLRLEEPRVYRHLLERAPTPESREEVWRAFVASHPQEVLRLFQQGTGFSLSPESIARLLEHGEERVRLQAIRLLPRLRGDAGGGEAPTPPGQGRGERRGRRG